MVGVATPAPCVYDRARVRPVLLRAAGRESVQREEMSRQRVRESVACRRVARAPGSLREVVDAYIRDYRSDASRELLFFARRRNLQDAISRAALAQLPGGKRHPHQYRIPRASLELARKRLLLAALGGSETFEELHSKVDASIGDVYRIGELAIYDAALRIGAFLNLRPRLVYLHRGTRDGARALGLGRGASTLDPAELPREFRRLRPHEIEDCLCIFKHEIARLAAARRAASR